MAVKGRWLVGLALVLLAVMAVAPVSAKQVLQQVAIFEVPEANQGIAVDENHFYAIDNYTIAKYDKVTGKLVDKWQGPKGGPVLHLDSGVVVDGKLYCAHSNYPDWPMTSSVEVWDAKTMKHIGTHSFGIHWGSFTWLDRHDGYWWAGFANYNRLQTSYPLPYGGVASTTTIKFDDNWQVIEAWVLPAKLLPRFEDMSNSGGSWGPDGRLYLSGHDPAEVYVMKLPEAGSVLQWLDTIPLNIKGQGIAWDRSNPGVLWGIVRATRQVTASKLVEVP